MASVDQLKELGKIIREKRGRMSATELGQKIGRSQSYVSALENAAVAQGQTKPITPPDEMLEAIADVLNVSVSEFHRALGRLDDIEYEVDPDLQMITEAYSGATDSGKRAIKSAAELALELSREGSIGKRAE